MTNNTKIANSRYRKIKNATVISAIFNLLFSISKITVGYVWHSSALLADGIHSFSDLLSDGIVFLGAYIGNKPADTDHPYGHHRIETLFAIVVSVILILVGLGLSYSIIHDLTKHKLVEAPSVSVLLTALFSIVANEWLFRYMNSIGQNLKATILISHAWHHRTDVYVSLLVLVSIAGTYFNIPYLDAAAALVIAVLIIKIGLKLIIDSIKELIDTGVDDETIATLRDFICKIPGVVSLHELRTRLHANMIILDVHILVHPKISVSEGHYIAERVKERLIKDFKDVKDVMVHVDPEDDEQGPLSLTFPDRTLFSRKITTLFKENNIPTEFELTIHYLEGSVTLDIYFSSKLLPPNVQNHKKIASLIDASFKNDDIEVKTNVFFTNK